MKPLGLALALAATMTPALSQERAPVDRQTMTELAYSLGEAHGLRRLCAGSRDGTWWGRMRQLIAVERPDAGLQRRLVEAFNAGYASRQAEFPACGVAVRAAERTAAAHGRALAAKLARR